VAPSSLPTVHLLHATQIPKPFHREGWVFEEKYDGWRMVVYKREERVQLISRPGRDHTSRFPELVTAGGRPPRVRPGAWRTWPSSLCRRLSLASVEHPSE